MTCTVKKKVSREELLLAVAEEVCDHHTTQIYSRAQLVLRPLEVLLKNETLNALTW